MACTDESINIQEEAQKMISEVDVKGMEDLQKLTLSMGVNAAKLTFVYLFEHAKHPSKKLKERLMSITDIKDQGCMQVDFYNMKTNKPDKAYLILNECAPGHDLGAQLDIIKLTTHEEKWPAVTKSLSMLIFVARTVYSQLAKANIDIIRKLYKLPDDDPCTKYLEYKVDMSNTTLYIDENWNKRIGIFVMKE